MSALVAWHLLEGYCPESICPLQLKRDYITHLSTPQLFFIQIHHPFLGFINQLTVPRHTVPAPYPMCFRWVFPLEQIIKVKQRLSGYQDNLGSRVSQCPYIALVYRENWQPFEFIFTANCANFCSLFWLLRHWKCLCIFLLWISRKWFAIFSQLYYYMQYNWACQIQGSNFGAWRLSPDDWIRQYFKELTRYILGILKINEQ